MKFVCDRCQTRYSIADAKVRQKILRIRCKTCGNVIVIEGEHASSLGEEPSVAFERQATIATKPSPSIGAKVPSSGPKAAPSSVPKAPLSSGPKSAPSRIPKAPSSSGPKSAPSAGSAAGQPPPPPPSDTDAPDLLGGRVEWYVAMSGNRSGPFSRAEAARRILAADPTKTTYVWKDGMPGWKPSSEVSVIAQELSLLRPSPPPPPPPFEPVKAHALLPSPAAIPVAAAAPSVKPTTASKSNSAFPETSPASGPAAHSDVPEFSAEPSSDAFSEIATTKKSRAIEALAKEPAKGHFSDVTTKRGKNLRELEAEPLFPTTSTFLNEEKTPPPVHPLAPIADNPVHPAPASSGSSSLSGAFPFSASNLPGIAATSPPAFPATTGVSAGQLGQAGFSEVIQAVAAGDRVSSPAQAFPAPVLVPMAATFSDQSSARLNLSLGIGGRLSALFHRQPALKYVIAVCVLVALVILLVGVSLRGDGSKQNQPASLPASTPAEMIEAPQPAVVEPLKRNPETERKPGEGMPAVGKRGSAKATSRPDVSPAPTQKRTDKTDRVLQARPNPFDDAKTVSQGQISAVVRSKTNQAALKSCYDRALKMDNRLTSGRVDVTVSIGTSGAVQRVVINAPPSFIMVEPCIKSAVKHWAFPPNSEEYATNFPLILQGGM